MCYGAPMSSPPTVYVSSLTYKRPQDLAIMLQNLRSLELPVGWDVRFLIVDNDPKGSGQVEVQSAASHFGDRLGYVVETTAGIPAARNRAIKEALAASANLLCFLDDDEVPDKHWLSELVSYWTSNPAALIGGPVKRRLPEKALSPIRRILGRSMIARRNLTDGWIASGKLSGVPRVYTNNWLCDLRAVRDHDLWFDQSLQFSGGSDTAFYLAVHKKGLKTGWCSTAIVYETLDPERMTVRYQFARGRTQGVVKAAVTNATWPKILITQIPRGAVGAALLVLPILGVGSYSLGLHLVGSAVGHFSHLFGGQSDIYAYGRGGTNPT